MLAAAATCCDTFVVLAIDCTASCLHLRAHASLTTPEQRGSDKDYTPRFKQLYAQADKELVTPLEATMAAHQGLAPQGLLSSGDIATDTNTNILVENILTRLHVWQKLWPWPSRRAGRAISSATSRPLHSGATSP